MAEQSIHLMLLWAVLGVCERWREEGAILECHSSLHRFPSLKPCNELQSPPHNSMESLDPLISSCLCHKPFFQSCHISLKAASHGTIPKCSLVLADLLRPVPKTATAPSEALGDSWPGASPGLSQPGSTCRRSPRTVYEH